MTDHKTLSRFFRKVDIKETNECWVWNASRNKGGYGHFGFEHRPGQYQTHYAHRVSFCAFRNYPLDYLDSSCVIRHVCDNPSCVNPNHLELGTHQDNVSDRVSKKRSAKGSRVATSKLTDEKVLEIVSRLKSGEKQKHIARLFGVKAKAISKIKHKKTWSHLFQN